MIVARISAGHELRRTVVGRRWVGLEVLGKDQVVGERRDEAVDLLFHVGVHQALEIADERLGAAVELLVEALDELLLEDAGAVPLAVGAAQRDLPVRRAGLVPLGGVDQVRRAGSADVKVVDALRGSVVHMLGDRRVEDLIVEVDDLDRLPRRKDDAADVVAVVGLGGPPGCLPPPPPPPRPPHSPPQNRITWFGRHTYSPPPPPAVPKTAPPTPA